jgi:hypothetical protein
MICPTEDSLLQTLMVRRIAALARLKAGPGEESYAALA